MNTLVMCIALVAGGIDVGWERRPEGGMEYIIQLSPQMLESLRAGETIQSCKLPDVADVRAWRIFVGEKQLPRDEPPMQFAVPKLPDAKQQPLAAPFALPPDPGGRPIPAACVETASTTNKAEPKTAPEVQPEEPAKPWLPLTFTLFGLFASLGANMYLGWIAWDLRQRFRSAGQAVPGTSKQP